MANRFSWRVGGMRIMQFAAVMAIVLCPAGGAAQGGIPAEFKPAIEQKLEARSAPAKVTSEEESALTSKGYVQIGTVSAAQPGTKTDAAVTKQLESAILKRAAEAGGDVVRFNREGALETSVVPTGKIERLKTCVNSKSVPVSSYHCDDSCYTDIHGFQHCNKTNCSTQWETKEQCLQWETRDVAVTKREKGLVSEGTVWRYDPKLIADIAAARVNARDENGGTQLHWEVLRGSRNGVELVLTHGADVNAKNKYGQTPLHFAAIDGHRELAELLLAHGADVNAKDALGQTPLHEAANGGATEVAELLLAHGADVNAKNDQGKTPLQVAADGKWKYVVELLRDPDLSAKIKLAAGEPPLQVLTKHLQDNPDYVRRRGKNGFTPLHTAAQDGLKDEVALLLAHGADVNAKDESGQTPLSLAAEKGHKDEAALLLSHGADVDAKDKNGDPPLWEAVNGGATEVAELLLAHGADANAQASSGIRLLHLAAERGQKEMAELLLNHGADVNGKNNSDSPSKANKFYVTPLHLAARYGYRDVVELLLAHGADVNAKDDTGWTPLHCAKGIHQDIVNLLRQHGGH